MTEAEIGAKETALMLGNEGLEHEEAATLAFAASFAEEDSICEELASQCEFEEQPPQIHSVKSNYGLYYSQRRRRIGLAVAGFLAAAALTACAAVQVSGLWSGTGSGQQVAGQSQDPPSPPQQKSLVDGPTCTYAVMPVCPARDLFVNPEVLKVAADSLMRVGVGILFGPLDEAMVQDMVAANFRNLTAQLRKRAPMAARELDMVQISEDQKGAVLSSMRLLADQRVQHLGLEVAVAIRSSRSSNPQDLRRTIEEKLRVRLPELLKLRDHLVPVGLQKMWGTGHQWEMTLDPENIKAMKNVSGTFESAYVPKSTVDLADKSLGILGGILEEGRALLDVLRICTRLFGRELAVPASAISFSSTTGISPRLLACEVNSERDTSRNFMKALFCPLKFGTQGLDALRALSDMVPAEHSGKAAAAGKEDINLSGGITGSFSRPGFH